MTYQIILFSSALMKRETSRMYGADRLASELRSKGFTVLVVAYSGACNYDRFKHIISNAVGDETIVVGFSTTMWPDRNRKGSFHDYEHYNTEQEFCGFHKQHHPWFYESLTYEFSGDQLDKYVDFIKRVSPKIKVVVGGSRVDQYMHEPKIDNVFIGFSENSFVEYCQSLAGQRPKRIYNKVINHDTKATIGDFNFNASSTTYIEDDIIFPNQHLYIEFSRGCIFNCSFCSYPHRNQQTKNFTKYKEVIYNELMDNYTKWGVTSYSIVDDTFNDYVEKLEVVNEVIQTLPFKPEFWCYARADLIYHHPKMAELMKSIGIKHVYYGLETWHDATAKAINKGGKLENKLKGLQLLRDALGPDAIIDCGIVIGLPKDTVESVVNSAEWFINGGHKIVNYMTYQTLGLRPDTTEFVFKSDIERDFEKYSYSFPNPNKLIYWERNDGGDISNMSIAQSTEKKCINMIKPLLTDIQIDKTKFLGDYNGKHVGGFTSDLYAFLEKHYWPKLYEIITK